MTGQTDAGDLFAHLGRYYGLKPADVAELSIVQARHLVRKIPDLLKAEATMIGVASAGGKL